MVCFRHPTEDHCLISAPPEVEDSIENANGENASGGGLNDEHDVSREGSLGKVARTILVRDSVGLTCIENLQSDTPEGTAGTTENIAGHGVSSDAHV